MKNRKNGFTLVEVIVSLALICIIAVGIIPAFAVQLKMTINTKELTAQSFDAQGEVERTIQTLKNALTDPDIDETAIDGVTTVTKNIFGRNVTLYKLIRDYPSNENKTFLVFLSKKLAEMEVRQLLIAEGVTIEVSNETIHKVADLKKMPKPTLIGRCSTNTDPNWYANLYKWYVSKEGDPDPLFPDDFERIVFSGVTPSTLTDLTKLANRYIAFTVTPVDIHGVRGNEVCSNNTVYVLGQEWRAGIFAWVDKDEDVSYAEAVDIKVEKSFTWPLVKGFNSAIQFQDPAHPDEWLNPENGSLYVPMGIDRAEGDRVGPIEVDNDDFIEWIVDKSIHLATDINVNNHKDIHLKSMDGNIVLYQYITIDPITKDVVFEADGMPSMVPYGPTLTVPYGKILFDTGGRGDVILQNYSTLEAGSDITLEPYGHVSAYESTLAAGGSITLDSTKGSAYPGNRDIVIQDSQFTLEPNSVSDRIISVSSLNHLEITDTIFTGNTGAASKVKLSALDGIELSNTELSNSTIQLESDTTMTGGEWSDNSTIIVDNNAQLTFGAAGSKVVNSGALVLGDTGRISFVSNMANDLTNPLAINLGQGGADDEVIISTSYGRTVNYADSSDSESITEGIYQNLGSGQTNLKYTAEQNSGYGSPTLTCSFDGENKITIDAAGSGPISAYYTLKVADRYAEDVTGSIVFKVTAAEGESPEVRVIGPSIPSFTVIFDKNGGTADAQPATMSVNDGQAAGILPQAPIRPGYNFIGWNTQADGSGTEFNGATIVTADLTVYAQYTLIPVYTVTFHKNGGSTEADPISMNVEHGSAIGTLPTPPSRALYQFLHWSTISNGGSVINAQTIVWNDMTAYAQWTEKKGFAAISNGEYVSINNVLFQKISTNQLLVRNRILFGTNVTMDWSTASSLAGNYYSSFSVSWNWVTNSGLADGATLGSLSAFQNTILATSGPSYSWWGGSRSTSYAYLVNADGTVSNYGNKSNNNSCRPYITVNATGLYVSSGTGTAANPYILIRE